MITSDYLSSNIIICILFWFDPFLRPRAETEKYLCLIFGSNENFKICFRDYLTFRGRPPSFQILANQLTLAPPEFSDLPTALELVSSIAKVSFFLVCPSYTLGCLKFDWISFLLEMVPNQFLINTVKLVFFDPLKYLCVLL